MARIRNRDEAATMIGRVDVRAIGISTTADPLLPGAAQVSIAPTSFNGCISELSSDAIHARAHDYTEAMKHYGVVYEEYQSYLMPAEQMLPHDYDMAAKPVPDFSHLGCLNTDLLEPTLHEDHISDDDIESCGYAAWVHH